MESGKLHQEICHGKGNNVDPITTDILIKGLYDKEKASAEGFHDVILAKLTKIKNLETLQQVLNQLYVQVNKAQVIEYQLFMAIGKQFNGMTFYNPDLVYKPDEPKQVPQTNIFHKIDQHLKGFA
jgi:trehalose/maltose hydrolase-like predicted phosphorylase